MHTDQELASQEEALFSLNAMLDDHRELIPCIKGVHIHQSLTGSYVKNWLKEGNILPEDPEERFCKAYEHIFAIDRHEPFTASGVEDFIKRVDPLYVTFEYITRGRGEHASYLEMGVSACSSLISHFHDMQQAVQSSSRYGKIRDLKAFAKAVSFLQGNNISNLSELQEKLSGMKEISLK